MGTEEAKAVYRQRASAVECVNAQARNRGLIRLLVRGLRKVTAVALWFAIGSFSKTVGTGAAAHGMTF